MTEKGKAGSSRVDTEKLLADVDIVKVIDGYVPLKKAGAEYQACCPFHQEATPSFKVSPAKQIFHCFGCGANGNAIGFLMEYKGVEFLDACRELGADIPEDPNAPVKIVAAERVKREPLKEKKPVTVWEPVHPVPEHTGEPPKAHPHRGLPERTWCYRDAEGRVLGYVYRFKTSDGGKETLPLSWARAPTGTEEWRWLSFAEPRPLYGLDRLAAKPGATVLVVEGEKCADAGDAELPDLVVVSWPGGGKAVDKADWSPLAGRKVMTWADCDSKHVPLTKAEKDALPDKAEREAAQAAKPLLPEADQPGVKAMAAVHKHLHAMNAPVWSIKIPPPGEKPDGWDIADAIEDGLKGAPLADHIRTNAVRVPPPGAVDEIDPAVFAVETISTATEACASPPDHDDGWEDSLWRRQLLRKDGKLIDCRENVYLMLRHHPDWAGVLWFDEFARRIVIRKPLPWERASTFVPEREWDDVTDKLRLGLWLAQRERLLIKSAENLAASVAWSAAEARWHPVRDYLDGLVWDGQRRTKDWLTDYLGVAKTEYTMLSGHMFLLGMVARIYEPGCQMRFMPILEGLQFRGKSSALRALGGKWFSDAPIDLSNKDTFQLIQGIWLYEIGELDAFNRAEATRIKAFISMMVDRFRAPYERAPRDWPRQGVFTGSTNHNEYFKDRTGNTRFWPWRVETVDQMNVDGLHEARDQLFAEALHWYRQGERRYPTADEQQRLFEPEQAEREVVDPWQIKVNRWLRTITTDRITVLDILTDCLGIDVGKIDRANSMATSVGNIMARSGWVKKRETKGTPREYYYERPKGWGKDEEDELAQLVSGEQERSYEPF